MTRPAPQPRPLTSVDQIIQFALAGKSRITLVSKSTGTRFTFQITAPAKATEAGGIVLDHESKMRFVKVLTGSDNESSYKYLGYMKDGLFVHGGVKAKVGLTAPSAKAFAWSWQQLAHGRLPDALEVWHEGACGRCGRTLTVPSSIASGFGPECVQHVGFQATAA